MVYLKQERFTLAEFHFTKATNIFRTNPDLICHLAVVRALPSLGITQKYYLFFPRLNTNVINLTVHWPYSMMHSKSILKMHFANFTSKSINAEIRWALSASSPRAGLLLHLERYQEALVELEELRQIAPKESLVYYLLSKVSDRRESTWRINPAK